MKRSQTRMTHFDDDKRRIRTYTIEMPYDEVMESVSVMTKHEREMFERLHEPGPLSNKITALALMVRKLETIYTTEVPDEA